MNADVVDLAGYGQGEWAYQSAYHLLLAQGQFFTPGARPSCIPKLPDQLCYQNAAVTARTFRARGLLYAEGFACMRRAAGIPIEHAWCVSADGMVVDPTWEPAAEVYFGVVVADSALCPVEGGGLLSDVDRCLPLLRGGGLRTDSG